MTTRTEKYIPNEHYSHLCTTGEPHTVWQSQIHLDITMQNNYRYAWIMQTRSMELKSNKHEETENDSSLTFFNVWMSFLHLVYLLV